MSSSTNPSETYTYQRPSTTATRAIVTGTNPKEQSSSSSTDVDAQQKSKLQQPTTDYYERAANEATKSGMPAVATPGTGSLGEARPAVQRQQSWNMRDLKGEKQGKMLEGNAGHGYSTTGGR